ncbi:MAG: hypothetical protein R3225_05960 [Halofilum sp. (in: g-proteobacteria)]|nr:hypothetical protein [Halofilum sp. (in: g-proteobacteria)]
MKRLLFFPGHRILAYEWERGAFRRTEAFEPDADGRAAFRAWLEEAPRVPVQMLLDVIEEEFHVDHVPHVIGRDRSELFKRTAQRHFRSTEFRYIVAQGREPDGRRDDRVLVAGLTNPELLKTWLSVIDDTRVPLKGIYSLPLVGEALLPALGAAKAPRALVITQQIPSTLRQSYYEHGRLRFSRLAPGRYGDSEGFATFVQRELNQTLHFLETQRFRRQGAPIDVYILVNDDAYHTLRDRLSSSETVACHLVPLDGVARKVGLRGPRAGAFADTLFGHLLLRQRRPANHYGLPRLRRHFFAQQARVALGALAGLLLLATVATGVGAWLRAQVYEQSIAEARARADEFRQRLDRRLQQLAEFDYRAQDVKNAVDLFSRLREARVVHPGAALAILGGALDAHPNIMVDRLNWRRTDQAELGADEAEDDAFGGGETGLVSQLGAPDRPGYQYLLVQGSVVGFEGEYRRAVRLFDGFVESLGAQPRVDRIEVVESPFALEPDSAVSGDSGLAAREQRAQRAAYSVLVRLGGDDG